MASTSLSARIPLVRQRTGWRAFFCAIALMSAFWFCPNRAQASCGDYVVIVNPSAEYLRNRAMQHASQPMSPSCPCQGPLCRSSDSTPPMPVPAQITPEFGAVITQHGGLSIISLFGSSHLDDWSIRSEAHLLCPDPPPRSLS
jgi:hypothetical protein